jgi:hypothetical protein
VSEASAPEGSTAPDGPYRFTSLVAVSWRFYSARFWPLFWLFTILATLILLFPLILLLDMTEQVELTVGLFTRFALPAVIASYGYAVIAVIHDHYLQDEEIGARAAARELRPYIRHVMSAALLSGMLGLMAVTFFAQLGVILLPLFYGPPMVMQMTVLEKVPVAEAWARSRTLMRGHWMRVITYLLSIAMGIGVLGYGAISAMLAATEDTADIAQAIGYGIVSVVITALTYPFLGTAQYIAFADIAALEAAPTPKPRRSKGAPVLNEAEVVEQEASGEMPAPSNHYEALGIKRNATQRQIRRAYQIRMRLLDPQRHSSADAATVSRMESSRQRAEEAYQVLSDEERRSTYDATL